MNTKEYKCLENKELLDKLKRLSIKEIKLLDKYIDEIKKEGA